MAPRGPPVESRPGSASSLLIFGRQERLSELGAHSCSSAPCLRGPRGLRGPRR